MNGKECHRKTVPIIDKALSLNYHKFIDFFFRHNFNKMKIVVDMIQSFQPKEGGFSYHCVKYRYFT